MPRLKQPKTYYAPSRDFNLNGKWLRKIEVDGVLVESHSSVVHASMLQRCGKEGTSYEKCSVSEDFLDYQYFAKWCSKQVGYECVDENYNSWQIDKDLLSPKNAKIYSEETCVFLPAAINTALIVRGDIDSLSCACADENGDSIYLGKFDTAEEAYAMYVYFKEQVIRNLAKSYKKHLSKTAYQALMKWRVK